MVTGASSGIGRAYAERLAQKSANIIVVARNRNTLETMAAGLKQRLGVRTMVIAKDLSKPARSDELFDEIQAAKMHVDILVNNAGFGIHGRLAEPQGALCVCSGTVFELDAAGVAAASVVGQTTGKNDGVGKTEQRRCLC